MRVWLLKLGEPLAVLDASHRPQRMSLLASALCRRGHQVTWWTSPFMHSMRDFAGSGGTRRRTPSGVEVVLLPSAGYKGHASLSRLREHRSIARHFLRESGREPAPDLIVSALPTVEFCDAATRYGRQHGIPVVLDVRDWWPDVLQFSAPAALRPFVKLASWPLRSMAVRSLRSAAAVTGITSEFVDWGLRMGGRDKTLWDRAFPFGYPDDELSPADRKTAVSFWDEQNVLLGPEHPPIAVFAGTLGYAHNLDVILEAAARLQQRGSPIRFVLCGDGERLSSYRKRAEGLGNVTFPGWVNRSALQLLLENAAMALSLLPDRADFLASINNKAIEYLRFGLPIIVSPASSALARVVTADACGVIVAKDSVSDLCRAVVSLASANSSRVEMSARARSLYEREFQASRVYVNMSSYLEEVALNFKSGCSDGALVDQALELSKPRAQTAGAAR